MKLKTIAFLLLFLFGCTSPRFVLDTKTTGFKKLLKTIDSDQDKISSLEGKARITIDSKEYSGNFFANISYKHPDSLLVTVKGPFGLHVGSLFIGKERFIFFNQISNQFMSGSVKDYAGRNFLQFPLKLSELIDIFSGTVHLNNMKIENYSVREDLFFIRATDLSENYEIWIDPKTGHLSKIEQKRNGDIYFRRLFGDFRKFSDVYFPQKIQVVRPVAQEGVSIYYTELNLNKPLDANVFAIKIPDRAEQINLRAGDSN